MQRLLFYRVTATDDHFGKSTLGESVQTKNLKLDGLLWHLATYRNFLGRHNLVGRERLCEKKHKSTTRGG